MLVVVAIIVALLAILMPAMNRAIYVSRITVCASNLHQIGFSLFNYAADNFGAYPWRGGYPNASHTYIKRGGIDWRPIYRPYLDINAYFNDPLAPHWLDYDAATTGNIYTSTTIWAGDSESGVIRRIVDRWPNGSGAIGGDYNQNFGLGGHPGLKGILVGDWTFTTQNPATDQYFGSVWKASSSYVDTVDHNYIFADASVRTFWGVTWLDSRMFTPLPSHFLPK